MPVVQPVLGTVTLIYIYMIIVGKSMPIYNYEQYKRVINQTPGDYTCTHTHIYIYILETKKLFDFVVVVVVACVVIYNNLLLNHL